MKALKFRLSGKTAFFKKPDVNTYLYFSYGNIHKLAILGILGAIVGYGGYHKQKRNNTEYPEFYEKLKDLKIGIAPRNEKGYITKKVQTFNNSVGYASKEKGGNLIVKEQWLENPSWDIYIMLKGEEEENIAKCLLENKYVFLPYLGKNDHIADISDIYIMDIEKEVDILRVDSLYIKESFDLKNTNHRERASFKYQEILPIGLEKVTNKYEFETFVFTDSTLEKKNESTIYKCEDKTIYFF